MPLAKALPIDWTPAILSSLFVFLATAAAVYLGYRPARQLVLRQEEQYGAVLRSKLLIDVKPRLATVLAGIGIVVMAAAGYYLTGSGLGAAIGLAAGVFLPYGLLRFLRRRRLARLEAQLVDGIQTLASGVRAGLNLVQAMELVARDAPAPISQEFAHLLREYEYGVPLEEAMDNAAGRIGSSDYRLLFAALRTHRQRGGDLGETLDRINSSIREIQRLEKRVQALTAQGRATARWLAALPAVVLALVYLMIDPDGVRRLFIDDIGKLILLSIVALNVLGFLWIRKVVGIDI